LVSLTLNLNSQLLSKNLQELSSSKKILIAYSGGLDSHVLLHLVSQLLSADYNIRAVHIHHGLQQQADAWVPHCQQICDGLNIPLHIEHLKLAIKKGESLEEVARNARYAAFKKLLQKDELLLTAHHQNDQAETLLLQLFRGAGVQGLAAMPPITEFASGQLARPLLNESLQSLKDYAKKHQLDFIEDPSNKDNTFDRNFLRNEIIPQLRKRWPSVDKTISRSALIQAETKQLLDEVAEQDLKLVQVDAEQGADRLIISKLECLSLARQKLAIRHWISINGFNPPSEVKLKHIFIDVINASEDAQPLLEWAGVEVRRYQGCLYIMQPLAEHDSAQVIAWDEPNKPLVIASLDIKIPTLVNSSDDYKEPITIRFRQGGEKITDSKRAISISLKNYLNEAGIPPWLRSRVPLIYAGNTLIKVHGLD
jgi:tRNA(Ile)-lysidine synthase